MCLTAGCCKEAVSRLFCDRVTGVETPLVTEAGVAIPEMMSNSESMETSGHIPDPAPPPPLQVTTGLGRG